MSYFGVSDSLQPIAYVPLAQSSLGRLAVILRGRTAPATLLDGARRVLAALNPEIAMARPRTLHQVRDESIARPRFLALLMGIFAGSALVLAAVGLSGLLSYMVAQRDRELSVRIALGAPRRHVLGIVVGQALALAGTGIGLGLIGALALTRVLRSLLFAVSPADPATFVAVAGVLLLIAIAASWFPAHRAARADPLATMRGD